MTLTRCALLFIVLALTTGLARADCPAGAVPLVGCTFDNGAKRLDTCLTGDHALYRFGRARAAPDLELVRSVREVGFTPWPGIGRTIWESFTFHNAGFDYEVYHAIEKMPEAGQEPLSGGVTVLRNDRVQFILTCDPGSVESAGYALPLFEAKEAAGQCWSLETRSWNDC